MEQSGRQSELLGLQAVLAELSVLTLLHKASEQRVEPVCEGWRASSLPSPGFSEGLIHCGFTSPSSFCS